MTIEEMEKRKKDHGYTYRQISEGSGVALGTVQKVLGRSTESPRYDTVQKLERFFVREQANYAVDHSKKSKKSISSSLARKDIEGQGSYTIEDYLAWPEEERIELIDGVIYDMAAPVNTHQAFALQIALMITGEIKKRKGSCFPAIAPVDVQLDADDRTMVQPDFMIICDKSKLTEKRVVGAPDFIVEVLSPSTKFKDVFIKQNKYMNAGVREYWTVDIKEKRVTVYLFSEGQVMQYGLDEVVPIGIYDGEIKVDFGEISDYIAGFLGEF